MARDLGPVKIPVGEVVIAAYRSVFGRFGLALELGWLPLLVFLAGILVPDLALRYLVPPAAAATSDAPPVFDIGDLGNLGEAAIGVFALSAFAVRWYQFMLFASPSALPFRLSLKAWLIFTGYGLAILALWTGLYLALAWPGFADVDESVRPLATIVEAAAVAGLFIGLTRLSLVFPAAAYGAPLGLAQAWQAMRGNVWRLIGINLLVAVPVVLTFSLMLSAVLAAAGIDPTDPTVLATVPLGVILMSGVIQALTGFVVMALAASILSEFYRRVVLA
jgi:hypothetical protein